MDMHSARYGLAIVLVVVLGGTGLIAGCADTTAPSPDARTDSGRRNTEDPVTDEALALAEITIGLEQVAEGFEQPLYVTGAGDGSGRLFVLEKTGTAWIVRDGERDSVFLDLSARVSTESEQGLLGIAFSPTFTDDGLVFVSYTQADGASVLSRFTVESDAVDPRSEKMLLHVAQPYANHNGGMIAFGPDGYLYFGLGDGGSGGDPLRQWPESEHPAR